jgi:hypothetical protein
MGDAQTAHDLLDQVADAANGAQAESPELSAVVADLQAARAQLDGQFSDTGVIGDPTSSDTQQAGEAYADALRTGSTHRASATLCKFRMWRRCRKPTRSRGRWARVR